MVIGEPGRADLELDDLVDQILGRFARAIRVVEIFFEIPTLALQTCKQGGKVVVGHNIWIDYKM